MKEETNVKKWYFEVFPEELDSFGDEIDETLTFDEVYNCFNEEREWNERVKTILDRIAFDSDIRDRILQETNDRYNMGENEIFKIYNIIMDDYLKKVDLKMKEKEEARIKKVRLMKH